MTAGARASLPPGPSQLVAALDDLLMVIDRCGFDRRPSADEIRIIAHARRLAESR